jgi:crooked neck
VWVSYAKYFGQSPEARDVFVRADRALRDRMLDQRRERESAATDRVRLLDVWLAWEQSIDDGSGDLSRVEQLMPKRIKRRRAVTDARGADAGWEEYYEYVFPEEQAAKPQLKILEAARKWKLARERKLLVELQQHEQERQH